METGGPVQELREEATCPICLEYFKEPVILTECSHNFCRACLIRSWGEAAAEASCPQCRERVQPRSLKPNRQLANVVEIAKKLSLEGGREGEAQAVEGRGRSCDKHQEPLKLFCREDRGLICVVCDRSKEHKQHDVVPVEEAAQEYKDKFHGYIAIQRKEKEKILTCKADTEKQSQYLLERIESAREKSVAEFRKLYQFLEEQEQLLLAQMEEVEKEIARERDEILARLSEDLSPLESLIHEMQEKIQQPANEFLQDIESIIKRYEKKEDFENSVSLTPKMIWSTMNPWEIHYFLDDDMKKFKDILASQIQLQRDTLASQILPQRANVTLDPDTAHPQLILSEDQKTVRWAAKAQPLPYNPGRFSGFLCAVLGCEGFTSGQHFWEVSVGNEGWWTVGVATKSVKRKGGCTFKPMEGIWAVGKMSLAYTDPLSCLALNEELERIIVGLNYDKGQVVFFNPDTAALLYKFSGASFCGETLFPFFYMFGNDYFSLSQNHNTGAT